MANPNINAGAQGNPLDALLAGRNPWGALGGLLYGSPGANMPQATSEGGDPIYGEGFVYGNDPRYAQAYQALQSQGLSQLRDNNIGGPGEARDPSQVRYDPQYGLVTSRSNIAAPNSLGDWIGPAIMALMAGGVGLYAAGGLSSAGVGASTATEGAGLDSAINAAELGSASQGASLYGTGADLAGSNAGLMGDLGGATGGSSGLLGGAEGLDLSPIAQTPAGSITPLQAGPFDGLGSQGLLGQAGNYIANNPLRAFGLAQTAYGLLGGGSHGAPTSGSNGSNGSSKGGTGQGLTPGNGQPQQFYQNPYTLAQLQRSRGGY